MSMVLERNAQVEIIDANTAVAEAVRVCRPAVVAAYPITPQTTIVEKIARNAQTGRMKTEYICVESEHSAMSACIGAEATGVRTFTATSSQGLLLMHEMLHWASLARLPIVMANVNRSLAPGWNIWSDNNDSMSQRDTGWLQMYASSAQEAFDDIIQAYRLAEDRDIMLPAMVNFDGFILSHTSMPVSIAEQETVDGFLPPFEPMWKLDVDAPLTHGNLLFPKEYNRTRWHQHRSMLRVPEVISKVAREFREVFGRDHGAMVEPYMVEDADVVLVALGALGAEMKVAAESLRRSGRKVGALRVRVYRPFPVDDLQRFTSGKKVIVLDRAVSPGLGGILCSEVRAVLPGEDVNGVIAGIGGMDVTSKDIISFVELAEKGPLDGFWMGVDGR